MPTDQDRSEIVDAHVHLWNLSEHPDWYPGLTGPQQEGGDAGIGDTSGLRRNYLLPDYDHDSANYRVSKFVHVSATQGPASYLGETRWLADINAQEGRPHALIGAIDPANSLKQIEAELDTMQRSSLLRGVRVVFGLEPQTPATRDFLRLLQERGLIFELVAHPHNALAFAHLLESLPRLQVVLEHCGWPTAPAEAGHFKLWQDGIAALAARGNIDCKLSGLAMALHSMAVDAQRPWLESCIEIFAVEHCMFASNFPVDALFGGFDALYGVYREVTNSLGTAAQRKLFVGNAERVYRI